MSLRSIARRRRAIDPVVRRRQRTVVATLIVGAAIAISVLGCKGDDRIPLVVYSPHGKELLSYYEQGFEKAHPNVDVQWVDMGSQDVLDRLRSEKDNPQADVWFGAPADIFEHGASEGLLDVYKPTWASTVPDEAHDPKDLWYGTYLTPEVIAYNTDAVTAAEAPKDWDQVLDPKWKGKIVIRDPIASGSLRAIFGGILVRSIKQTGSTAQGWDWLRRLDASTKSYAMNATVMYQQLGRKEAVLSLYDMPDIATLQQRTKIPVSYTIPTSGTPLLVDGIAIVHGTKHADIAKQYYEYVTSQQAVLAAARQFLRIPARKDLAADSLPTWIREADAQIKPMDMDRQLIADSLNTWMKYWDAHVRNCCKGK